MDFGFIQRFHYTLSTTRYFLDKRERGDTELESEVYFLFSSFRRRPKSQPPCAAEHKPRLRLECGQRAEDNERDGHKEPFKQENCHMPPSEPGGTGREKHNAQHCRGDNPKHCRKHERARDAGDTVGKEGCAESCAADERGEPPQEKDDEYVRRP